MCSVFSSSLGKYSASSSRGQTELNPARNQNLCGHHQQRMEVQLALGLLLLTSPGSTISHLLSVLQPVTLLAYSLNASPCMPAVALYYRTFQGIIL